jgi:hypothetical protein
MGLKPLSGEESTSTDEEDTHVRLKEHLRALQALTPFYNSIELDAMFASANALAAYCRAQHSALGQVGCAGGEQRSRRAYGQSARRDCAHSQTRFHTQGSCAAIEAA